MSQRHIDGYERGILPFVSRALRAFARTAVEPLDFAVGVVGVLVGLAFAVFLAVEGASAIEVGLVVVLVAGVAITWTYTSWARDWWRGRRGR